MPVEQHCALCELHHVINVANNLLMKTEHHSEEEPQITVCIEMTGKNKQQVKLLPLQWTTSCTCDTLSSDLVFFYLCYDIVDSTGAGRVAPLVDVVPLHAAKRHEVGDGFLLKSQRVGSAMNGAVIWAQIWCAIGLQVEIGGNLIGCDG